MNQEDYFKKLKSESLSLGDGKKELPDNLKGVLNTFNGGKFGCQSNNVLAFANAFCDFDFSRHFLNYIPSGTILKIVKEFSNYTENTLVCMITGGHAFCPVRNSYGDNTILWERIDNEVRYASLEEIEIFYNDNKDKDRFYEIMNTHSSIKAK